MDSLQGRVALVTGATKNIGATIAATLAASGVRVVATGRAVEDGERVVRDIRDRGGSAIFVRADMGDEDQVRQCVDRGVKEFGGLHYLVNNAAPIQDLQTGADRPVTELSTEGLEHLVRVGMFGTVWFLKYAIPHMEAAGSGAIVNISSTVSLLGQAGLPVYTMIKGALNSLTRQLAVDYSGAGIRCNAIVVGMVRGSAGVDYLFDHPTVGPRIRESLLTRPGEASDIASLTRFLLSDEAGYITGAVIPCDGGTAASLRTPDVSAAFDEMEQAGS